MNETPLLLGHLAYACRLYEAMTDFSSSLLRFRSAVGGSLDLSRQAHRQALLRWLNSWGCRNLALACHEEVSGKLAAWYGSAGDPLPDPGTKLVDMTEESLDEFAELFDSLAHLVAREGNRLSPASPAHD